VEKRGKKRVGKLKTELPEIGPSEVHNSSGESTGKYPGRRSKKGFKRKKRKKGSLLRLLLNIRKVRPIYPTSRNT